ncbi:PTS lactose/cellobiose transporter subunit IIA [Bacillus sonorensis]|uniref:Lichenan-specific phosphotransferase system IIA component LicA n=2 Tax=Bacillus sonorensis TaxID=119858 RepID=M5PC94_9BACI|nr:MULTISPECIES: PTS lactose/cellobiose transporter subunit IIA [Bacillus]TWK80883.1 Lichenan-specific phosphotransferase enzyme IIA component [Bacillus paralicheniformis]ASB86857.1 Protein-N(pi)-phosphohistidine--sugar phosphotransferase [Bacillus sonorensis]EME73650.1 lichenan-specific phosphotransferase system IIA component LicA [Bacillus sonorensis L12]MBG9914613.1 PTS cellobiose transporter subunit IIA [Bacillus sonorensis]MCF7616110.1 PTS lactose/cellobiose transporter subunit IIA [Bacil
MTEELEQTIFQIILHGGNGRSFCMEAIAEAKKGDFAEAKKKLQSADEELIKAHHFQTALIQNEAKGTKTEPSLLMIHAQDHLMNAMTMKDLASEIVDLYKNINIRGGVN